MRREVIALLVGVLVGAGAGYGIAVSTREATTTVVHRSERPQPTAGTLGP